MEFEQLITLINTVSSSKLTHFSIEHEGYKITMKADRGMKIKAMPVPAGPAGMPAMMPVGAPAVIPAPEVSAETAPAAAEEPQGNVVKSPLVGTFYNAQSPDAAPFVRVGDTVKKGQVLGIVEAMKLMNEITSEYDGAVKEILVENEQMVEYGQPLFVIG